MRQTAVWRLLRRSERLRALKRRVLPKTSTRRRVPKTLGVEGFLQELQAREAKYVVLRWFDGLPRVEAGEDLDVLVSDEHAALVDDLLTRDPRAGDIKVDLYSVHHDGGFGWNSTSYFPPHLSQQVLDRAVKHTSGALTPCTEHHFLTLAFHAVYHKGYGSGLPVSGDVNPSGLSGGSDP